MRILIMPGWGHSAKQYDRLKHDLEKKYNCEVDVEAFAGFGETTRIGDSYGLPLYVQQYRITFKVIQYDYVIAHSMGANILLKALAYNKYKTVPILVCPAYHGIPKLLWLLPFKPLIEYGLRFLQKHPNAISKNIVRRIASITVNNTKKINNQIITDILSASPKTAANTLIQLICDDWHILPNMYNGIKFHTIYCDKDKLISSDSIDNLLYSLYNKNGDSGYHIIKNCGHTPVIESYDQFFATICKIIG